MYVEWNDIELGLIESSLALSATVIVVAVVVVVVVVVVVNTLARVQDWLGTTDAAAGPV